MFTMPVMPLWHHDYDEENVHNINRLASALRNNHTLLRKIAKRNDLVLSLKGSNNSFNLCFGCQCYIKLKFLELLENKYHISNLVNVVHNRTDRCSLERVFGLLFCQEYPKLLIFKSLFGDIMRQPRAFSYTYDEYSNDLSKKIIIHPFVKVWTGR